MPLLYLLLIMSIFFTLANLTLLPLPANAQPSTNSSSQNLSNSPGSSTDPQIAVYQNNVYVVWSDNSTGNGDIYFKRSVINGTSFESTRNLSDSPGSSTDPQIAVYQNNVYVVWSDNSTGNGDIYFKRSVINGTIFSETRNLSNNTGLSSNPQLSAVGSNVYVAWTDTSSGNNEILFRHSNNTGERFRGASELSRTLSVDGEYSLLPRLSANGSNVYVVWQDKVSGNYEIFLRESDDVGDTFGSIKNLSRNNTGDSISPRIASSGNNVYVAWTDSEPGKTEILLRASNDNAATFGGIKNVSWSGGDSYDPKVDVAGDSTVYVLWEDTSFTGFSFDLILRASHNTANTFQNKANIGRYVGEIAEYSQIAASGNNVFVVWSEAPRYSYPPIYKVFLEASRDNGKSFDDAINLSTGQGSSIEPKIAVSEKNKTVFVIWSEIINGSSEIHFVKLNNFF